MGWTTRGAGRNYDSLTGIGALVGSQTGQILDYGTCNRKCRMCDMGHVKSDHDCRKNFDGSSEAMEPHVTSKLVNSSKILKSINLEVGISVGGDDNNSQIKKDAITYLQRCFTFAIAENRGDCSALADTIRWIPKHAFNDHSACGT